MKPKSPTRLTMNAFVAAAAGSRTFVPVADEQIGAETDGFPEDEELKQVVRHDQHQHREGKERDVAEEAGIARISSHIPDGIDVDE